MSTEAAKAFIDEEIVRLAAEIAKATAELEKAKGLRSALDNEQWADKLSELLSRNGQSSSGLAVRQASGHAAKKGRKTNYEQIVAFFEARGNEWVAAPEIIAGTGITRGVVSNILYMAHTDKFDAKEHPQNPRMKVWRLKK